MKKMKKALFAVFAAFSLSACDFDIQKLPGQVADTVGGWIDSVKDFVTGGGNDKDKKEEQPCEHQDANHDGVCDLCGETGLVVTHTDANHDHLCDVCGAEVSQCKDDNHDHLCDECGATLSQHKDEDNNFQCDVCGEALKAVKFELDTTEATKEFAKGESFSSAGVKVIVTSEVGSKQELTQLQFSEPDMSEVGEKTITVSYEFAGEQHSDEYSISVSYWSESDLEVFAAKSYTGYASLPYMAGHNMRTVVETDEEGEITDWSIVADNIDNSSYFKYYNLLKKYSAAFQEDDGSGSLVDVSMSMIELSVDAEGAYGLTDVNVFVLVPTYQEEEDGELYDSRFFNEDEFILIGMNENDQLVLKNKFIDSLLDAMFYGTEFADGEKGYYASAFSNIKTWFGKLSAESECASDALVFPEVEPRSSWFFPTSYLTKYPFSSSTFLNSLDIAWSFDIYNVPEETYNAYLGKLTNELGFELVQEEGYPDAYIRSDKYVGYMEYDVQYYKDAEMTDGSKMDVLILDFYYSRPESYTNHLGVVADKLSEALGFELSYDNEDYLEYKMLDAIGYLAADGSMKSGLDAMEVVARKLVEEGYTATGALKLNEATDEFPAYYSMGFCDGATGLSVFVDQEASSAGYLVEMYVYDSKDNSISKAESEVKLLFPTSVPNPLRDFDYFENEDGSFTFYLPWGEDTLEEVSSVEDLELYAKDILVMFFFGDGVYYEVASSAATEDKTWVAVFDDVVRGFELKSEAYLTEAGVVTAITISEKVFVTPKSAMVDFLTAAKGAAPEESDYQVKEDGSCEATFAIEGEHTAEELKTIAEQYAAYFTPGYETISSLAGTESSWVVIVNNAGNNIEATIAATLGENGVSITVTTGPIPVAKLDAAKVVEDTNANFANVGYSFSITWDDENEEYSLGVNFGASSDTSETSLKNAAQTLASFLPEYVVVTYEGYQDPANGGVDVFGDSTITYYMALSTTDGSADIVIISYVYNGKKYAQISITDAAQD